MRLDFFWQQHREVFPRQHPTAEVSSLGGGVRDEMILPLLTIDPTD